jgi:hypothetical protein
MAALSSAFANKVVPRRAAEREIQKFMDVVNGGSLITSPTSRADFASNVLD